MNAMRVGEKKAIDGYQTQILLRELYDREYQIADHSQLSESRPLSLVGLHPKEQTTPYGSKARTYRRFATLRVGELFNISITEFLNQPREDVEMMFAIAEDKTLREDRETDGINRQLELALKGGR